MAFHSSDDPPAPPGGVTPDGAEGQAGAQSEGVARFTTCRWQQPAEDQQPAFCTHREVKPLAGTTSFDPDAWCADCTYYKVRRVPKRRPPQPAW